MYSHFLGLFREREIAILFLKKLKKIIRHAKTG